MLTDNAMVNPQINVDRGITFGDMADGIIAQEGGRFRKAFRMVE